MNEIEKLIAQWMYEDPKRGIFAVVKKDDIKKEFIFYNSEYNQYIQVMKKLYVHTNKNEIIEQVPFWQTHIGNYKIRIII